ncbi:DUF4124 domain-containing protein [Variovorax sp. LT1P1]|uniref:DUF4124 domain-containing protein n=1 Tax=Variovorax sp. LT1P1 TaxID=3443730 RepID=UPI003F459AAA
MKLVTLIAFLAVSGANAQVHRCIDAGGKATYSDVPCSSASKRAERVLGREATDATDDPYAAQRTMESIQRARELQQGTVNSVVQRSQGSGGAVSMDAPQTAPRPRPSQNDAEGCETISTRQGCVGGERARNPNWSPRKGYYGGGGPADQRAEAQKAAAAQARAAAQPTSFTNCDKTGCWGNHGGRYNFVAGGNLAGPNGSFCTRAAGGTFSCN